MGFKLVILQPAALGDTTSIEDWPDKLKQAIPDIQVTVCNSAGEAMESIEDADAAFGDIAPELFARAGNLKWIACPQAGPRSGYYHQALIDSEPDSVVSVSEVPGQFNPHWEFVLEDGCLRVFTGEPFPELVSRRQDLPPVYTRNGAVYVFWKHTLMDHGSIYGQRSVGYVMPPEFSVNIDSLLDLAVAEHLLSQHT